MLATVPFLRWSDVDPAGHEFDPEPARRIVARHVEAAVAGRGAHWRDTPTDVRDALVTTFEREFVGEYGAWASGWHWAASEPGGGGPVRGWCCSRDSLFRRDDPDPQATVERVVAALAEWQQFLVDLAATFADLYQETAEFPLADQVERAAARLLPLVVERTGTEDAWYNTFTRTLLWCLESFGRAGSEVERAVEGVVDGQFSSWCAPDEDAAREACAQLGLAVAEAAREASAGAPPARELPSTTPSTARSTSEPARPNDSRHHSSVRVKVLYQASSVPVRSTTSGRSRAAARSTWSASGNSAVSWYRSAKVAATVDEELLPFGQRRDDALDGRLRVGVVAAKQAVARAAPAAHRSAAAGLAGGPVPAGRPRAVLADELALEGGDERVTHVRRGVPPVRPAPGDGSLDVARDDPPRRLRIELVPGRIDVGPAQEGHGRQHDRGGYHAGGRAEAWARGAAGGERGLLSIIAERSSAARSEVCECHESGRWASTARILARARAAANSLSSPA
ncbi:hypothetical protein [Nannocystis bainbridge]|uniref:Uncharacterized protein n=1 Tax=Nannocystis bainbridge TaxID=2995303 RepID=A0ABT5EG24_9BACT|nr:hypothetical protein [Nannocystis bainbridge]MDC0723767.1 hypothetical protein [Nannocystis bainbridge]